MSDRCVASVRQRNTMQVKAEAKTLFWGNLGETIENEGIFMGER